MCESDIGGIATRPTIEAHGSRVIVALDGLSLDQAAELVEKIGHRVYGVKIHNLFDKYGTAAIVRLQQAGAEKIWVDAKLHDIPTTVGHRAKAISEAGADILTVHASGGAEMLKAAVNAFDGQVYAVSVLTSLSEGDTEHLYGRMPVEVVRILAKVAANGGVHGLVCSPEEVGRLSARSDIGNTMKFITPGIRPTGAVKGDQQRVGTPSQAIRNGANLLVIGRPIVEATDPVAALDAIDAEVRLALS